MVFNREEGIWKSVVEPVFEILKSVEVEKTLPTLVEEEMAKRLVLVEEALFSMVRVAYGDEVPRPTFPVVPTKVN